MSAPLEGYKHCDGCGLDYADTDCGQDREHTGCPHLCAMCGKPIIHSATGHPQGACPGHSIDEFREWQLNQHPLRRRPE